MFAKRTELVYITWARISKIDACSRAGWPDTEITNPSDNKRSKCTEEQKIVFTQLQAYASSRPLGSPGFKCYSRRKTGTDLDLKSSLFKRGHVITEWQKQLISASPPNKSVTKEHCIYNKEELDPLNNWGQGKCFEITVPENATYVSFEPKYTEIVFPVGCVFEVISDEQPGKPIKVMLNQNNVKRGSFGWVQKQLTTNQWWNGVVEPIHLAEKLWKDAYIKTPGGVTADIATTNPAIRQRVRDDFQGSTIVLVEPKIKDLEWIKSEIYGMVALKPPRVYAFRQIMAKTPG